jgi:hypothetical protein
VFVEHPTNPRIENPREKRIAVRQWFMGNLEKVDAGGRENDRAVRIRFLPKKK